MTQHYVRFRQEMINSNSGNRVWAITLIGTRDRQLYTTYVDPRNRNYSNWSHVVHRPQNGFVLNGIQIKNQKKQLVDADSRVVIAWESSSYEQVLEEMYTVWQEQDTGQTQFEKMFE